MDRDYDLFERLPDGQIVWRAVLRGRDNATHKAQELAALSTNEFIAIHIPSQEVIARLNFHATTSVEMHSRGYSSRNRR